MVKILQKSDVVSREARPWGEFEVLHIADNHKIKRLYICAGQKTSLQLHHFRSEHWLVESGVAKVVIDGKMKMLSSGQSIDVPRNALHRIENLTDSTLVMIEAQSGRVLREDDIVRVEDEYGRV